MRIDDSAAIICSHGKVCKAAVTLALTFAAASLYGCCDPPEPQLNWEPDLTDFKKKAEWFDDKGIWRGNPTWTFFKELEVEDYQCRVENRGICVVWTLHEWNCDEHDFGVCKCFKLSDPLVGNYCEEWGCHALEADQEVCSMQKAGDDENKEHCEYVPLPMNEQLYTLIVNQQDAGALTTGEVHRYQWWLPDAWPESFLRRLQEVNASHPHDDHDPRFEGHADARELAHVTMWPPPYAYNPAGRAGWFHYRSVCIVNGDNKGMARRRCSSWREIETEISQCRCLSGSKNACLRWTCEERDVGLFSIVFRTREDIKPYTEGSEIEMYECKQLNSAGYCVAWEGDIESREEVEWTRCECTGGDKTRGCSAPGTRWFCDEYEYPKTLNWNHPEYKHNWVWFPLAEIFGVCVFFRVCGEGAEDAIPVGLCFSCCWGICIFPFLMVTYGAYAFLFLGLPFWVIRFCFCCAMFVPTACGAVAEGIESLTEGDKPVKKSSKERFKRGATKIIGKRTKSSNSVAPEETNETNENNEVSVIPQQP